MDVLLFIITALATWRISSMFVREDGPFDVFDRIRILAGVRYDIDDIAYGTNVISSLLSCLWCTSIWVAFVTALYLRPVGVADWFVMSLALSAMSILFDKVLNKIT